MESWAVGEVCRQDKVRFLAIRVVSDTIDDLLPEDLDRLIAQPTTARLLGSMAGTLMRRPSSIKDMWRLRRCASRLRPAGNVSGRRGRAARARTTRELGRTLRPHCCTWFSGGTDNLLSVLRSNRRLFAATRWPQDRPEIPLVPTGPRQQVVWATQPTVAAACPTNFSLSGSAIRSAGSR